MGTTIRCSTGLAILVALALGTPATVAAQLTLLNATGFGTIGMTAGLVAGAVIGGTECDGFICVPPAMAIGGVAGAVVGIASGGTMAGRANRMVRDGEAVTPRHRVALAAGSVIGGAALGAMLGGIVAQGGRHEDAANIGMVAGAGVALLYLHSRWSAFKGQGVQIRPAIVGGEAGLTARIRF